MKKAKFLLPLLFVFGLLSSCSEKSENEHLPDFKFPESELFGTWQVKEFGDTIINDSNKWNIIFEPDGTFWNAEEEMTYLANGQTITVLDEVYVWGKFVISKFENGYAEGQFYQHDEIDKFKLKKISNEAILPDMPDVPVVPPSSLIEGTYLTHRKTEMVNLPPTIPFTPLNDEVTVKISASADNYIDVTLPSTSYNFNGQPMTIPAFTISNIPVLDAGEEGVFTPKHDFKTKEGNKDIVGSIKIEIDADGNLDMEVAYKYGAMPFGLKQVFESVD